MPWRWSGCRSQLLTLTKIWSVWFLKGHRGGLDLAWTPGTHKSSLTSSPQLDRGRKIQWKAYGPRQDRDISITSYHHGQNRLKEINLIYWPSNQTKVMRNKINHKLPCLFLPQIHFTLNFPYLLPHSAHGNRKCGLWSHFVSAGPPFWGARFLTLFPCSIVGFVP